MEIWKEIISNKVSVSNLGNANNLDWRNLGKGIVKPFALSKINNQGHRQICYRQNGRIINMSLHRLIWEAFNGEIPTGFDVHHIDEDPNNNRLDNLKVLSRDEHNKLHGIGFKIGHKPGNTKKSAKLVKEVKKLLDQGYKAITISEMLDISWRDVGKIKRGERFRNII